MEKKGFFARLLDLWRGIFGVRLSGAEARNAEAVYHNAVRDHMAHHDRLKDALARLVYLRNRLEADLQDRLRDVSLVNDALHRCVCENQDERALALMRKKRSLDEEIARLEQEVERMNAQTAKAKEGLSEIVTAIKRLKQERAEMLARKAHALARRDAQVALQHLTDRSQLLGSMAALENVRESIFRLESTVDLDDESPESTDDISMAELRRQAELESDQQALSTLKRQLRGHLLESGDLDDRPVSESDAEKEEAAVCVVV